MFFQKSTRSTFFMNSPIRAKIYKGLTLTGQFHQMLTPKLFCYTNLSGPLIEILKYFRMWLLFCGVIWMESSSALLRDVNEYKNYPQSSKSLSSRKEKGQFAAQTYAATEFIYIHLFNEKQAFKCSIFFVWEITVYVSLFINNSSCISFHK